MADGELEVLLTPANNLEDEIDSPQVDADVGRGGRRGAGAGAGQVGGIAALGSLISPITAVVGILTAILSQLRSVQQFTGGIFRIVQRKLAPIIASFIQLLRPAISNVTQALANFNIRDALSSGFDNVARTFQNVAEDVLSAVGIDKDLTPDGPGAALSQEQLQSQPGIPTGKELTQPTQGTEATRPDGLAPFFADTLDSLNAKTADRQDEEKKQIIGSAFSQKTGEKTGGGLG